MTRTRVKLRQDLFNRWIITPADAGGFAWSGSRWVPIGGSVQVCNFDTETQADSYATGAGFEVDE